MHKRSWMASLLVLACAGACSDGGRDDARPTTGAATLAAAHAFGARPAWATAERFVGELSAGEPVALQVHLSLRNVAQAEEDARAVSDPSSERYGQFSSDEDFAAKYLPTADDVAAVRAHLEASGLRVARVSASRTIVAVEGTAAAVARAFATRLGVYQVGASTRRAPIDAPSLPSAIASRVAAVVGLSTPHAMKPHGVQIGGVRADDASPDARVCSAYFGGTLDTTDPTFAAGYPSPLPYVTCGFTPPQIRKAYGLDEAVENGIDGHGRTVAIVDAYMAPTLLADAQTYVAAHDPSHPLDASQFTTVWGPGTPTPTEYGWYGEQALDVEAVHAVAPGANIVFVGAQSADDTDLMAALQMVIDQHLATIVSNSWDGSELDGSDYSAWRQIFLQGALKGIGFYFSSGDSGDESVNYGKPTVDFPASSDLVTAVGGTSIALGEGDVRLWETGWETGKSKLLPVDDAGTAVAWTPAAPGAWAYGSGGGTSGQFAEPWYQRVAVPRALTEVNGKRWRVVPDVSMVGDPVTGFLIGQTSHRTGKYGEGVIGGTSLACPLFAATMALGEQLTGRRFGFANPLLYRSALVDGLRDVRPLERDEAVVLAPGSVATFGDDSSQAIHTARGYDDVTGLGSPRGFWFLATLQ